MKRYHPETRTQDPRWPYVILKQGHCHLHWDVEMCQPKGPNNFEKVMLMSWTIKITVEIGLPIGHNNLERDMLKSRTVKMTDHMNQTTDA